MTDTLTAPIPTTYIQPVLTRNPSPSDYGIPHDSWRPNQYEGLLWAESVRNIGIIQAATGSGKSTWPAALSHNRRTCVLTRTKSLQQQYASYNGYTLMGKTNYPCIHPENEPGSNCGDCLYDSMSECDMVRDCVYVYRRQVAMHHRFPCVNYAYWLSSALFRKEAPEILVLDECHLAPDIALDYAGTEINESRRVDYSLPRVPVIRGSSRADIEKVLGWFAVSRGALHDEYKRLRGKLTDNPDKRLSRRANAIQNLDRKICATREALGRCPEAWYIRSGPQVCRYRGRKVPGIIIKPLTARYHFPDLFLNGDWKTVLMSATVGDFKTFADELGVSMDKCMVRRVPSNFPPSTRPIHVLDAPKLNWKSKEPDYLKQAEVIAEAIKDCPSEWSGLIHTTRIAEGPLLAARLVKYGVDPDRLWTRPRGNVWLGTQEIVADWERFLERRPNAIAVSCVMQEGYDGLKIDMVFTAKVPYPPCSPGSYGHARMKYSHRVYNQMAAWMFQQQQGRNRRGRAGDYDTPEKVVKYNAVADGNIMSKKILNRLDPDFREALVQ